MSERRQLQGVIACRLHLTPCLFDKDFETVVGWKVNDRVAPFVLFVSGLNQGDGDVDC